MWIKIKITLSKKLFFKSFIKFPEYFHLEIERRFMWKREDVESIGSGLKIKDRSRGKDPGRGVSTLVLPVRGNVLTVLNLEFSSWWTGRRFDKQKNKKTKKRNSDEFFHRLLYRIYYILNNSWKNLLSFPYTNKFWRVHPLLKVYEKSFIEH